MLTPPSQPTHLPIIEAGTQLYRVTEAEELRFQHYVDGSADQHILLLRRGAESSENNEQRKPGMEPEVLQFAAVSCHLMTSANI